MLRKQLTLLVLISITNIVVADKSVTMTCSTTLITQCQSGYAFNLVGNGYSESICVPSGSMCSITLNQQITLKPCTYDYSSNYCSTKVCFSLPSQPIAISGVNCMNTYRTNYSCASCQNCNSSTFCRIQNDYYYANSSNVGPTIECLAGCPSLNSNSFDVSLCSGGQDALGVINNCCITFLTNDSLVCITSSSSLNSTGLAKWVLQPFQITTVLMNVLILCLGIYLF